MFNIFKKLYLQNSLFRIFSDISSIEKGSEQYNTTVWHYYFGLVTIALKMNSAISSKGQSKTEDIFENILNNSTILESFNTFITK